MGDKCVIPVAIFFFSFKRAHMNSPLSDFKMSTSQCKILLKPALASEIAKQLAQINIDTASTEFLQELPKGLGDKGKDDTVFC